MALAKKPYVVLDAEILSSSVWSQAASVKLVWITLLVLCDTEGYVGASVPGIASAAGVTLQEAEDAIRTLQEPDPYSRTKSNDGRRLEVAERGFRILNFIEHLDRLSSEKKKARERLRAWRARNKKKREERDGNVSVRPEKREKGTGNREKGLTDPSSLRSEGKTPSWVAEAVNIWEEKFGGKPPGGYGGIGKALKDAVSRFGAADVLKGFRAYLEQSDPKYASPAAYSSKIASWVNLERSRPIVAPTTEEQAFGLIQREGWLREFEAERGKSATLSAVEFTRNKLAAIT